MKRKSFFNIIVGLVFCTVLSLGSGKVFADGDVSRYRLAITPTMHNIEEIVPGETYKGEFRVLNMGEEDFDFTVSVAPYSVADGSYTPNYALTSQYTDIVNWITVDNDAGSLASGEDLVIKYTIKVPIDAHGGAQAATILTTMVNNDQMETNAVQTVRQVGYVIYGNVDGDIIKTGKVLENKIPQFLFNPPIMATSLVENTGNVYTRAEYKLQVFPLFSDEEVYTNEENPENSIVFPETKRYNEIKWEGAPQLGIFRVRSTVKIFDTENVEEKLVFLCPLWFLFVVILLIFLIIFWIFSRIFKRRNEA